MGQCPHPEKCRDLGCERKCMDKFDSLLIDTDTGPVLYTTEESAGGASGTKTSGGDIRVDSYIAGLATSDAVERVPSTPAPLADRSPGESAVCSPSPAHPFAIGSVVKMAKDGLWPGMSKGTGAVVIGYDGDDAVKLSIPGWGDCFVTATHNVRAHDEYDSSTPTPSKTPMAAPVDYRLIAQKWCDDHRQCDSSRREREDLEQLLTDVTCGEFERGWAEAEASAARSSSLDREIAKLRAALIECRSTARTAESPKDMHDDIVTIVDEALRDTPKGDPR